MGDGNGLILESEFSGVFRSAPARPTTVSISQYLFIVRAKQVLLWRLDIKVPTVGCLVEGNIKSLCTARLKSHIVLSYIQQ